MYEKPFSLVQAEQRILALETLLQLLLNHLPPGATEDLLERGLPAVQMQHPDVEWTRYVESHLLIHRTLDRIAGEK